MQEEASVALPDEALAEQSAVDQAGVAAPAAPAPAVFDRLNQGPARPALKRRWAPVAGTLERVEDLRLEQSFQSASYATPQRRTAEKKTAMFEKHVRKERNVLPEPRVLVAQGVRDAQAPLHSEIRILTLQFNRQQEAQLQVLVSYASIERLSFV